MVEVRWIIFSSFLMLLFSFTDAATRPYTVRVGDEVTLSCGNMIDDQEKCGNTAWLFWEFGEQAVTLVEHGQIHNKTRTKSERLSVTENCSLAIEKVPAEEAGYYTCKQIKSGEHNDTNVYLAVVTMTEHEEAGKVTLNCSVSPPGWCRHTVKWLYEGKDVNEDNKDMETSQSECSVTVTFQTSYLKQKSEYHEFFKCEVTDLFTDEVQQFNFSRQSSEGDATTATTKSPPTMKSSTNNNNEPKQEDSGWWWIIIVSVGVAALLIIIIVAVIRWKRTKGNKTQSGADPEHVFSKPSISYNKKTNSKAWTWGDDGDDDDGDTETYINFNASSSSAGASTDPGNIYTVSDTPNT